MDDITADIQALENMTAQQLRQRWMELYGEQTHTNNKPFMKRRLAWRIQALKEGTLSERAQRRAEELALDADFKIRCSRDSCATDPVRTVVVRSIDRDPRLPVPGTVLVRDFKGQRLLVRVLEKGFEFEDSIYPSLSAIATKVAGTRWNGFVFFGLNEKNRKEHASA